MKWHGRTALIVAGGLLAASLAMAAPRDEAAVSETEISRSVRKELEGLPYYGVFDLLTYQVNDKGLVTLGGYVYEGSLKSSAERAVQKVSGVKEVENKIELLPVSQNDDRIRWDVYRAIYRDSFLSRYGTPDEQLLGTRPRFRDWGWGYRRWGVFGEPFWLGRPFFGMEPVGEYAIHIIVSNGDVTLAGVVDSPSDRNVAGLRANGVFGAMKVVNDLQVAPNGRPAD
jgi:osmotically-inducible protein OsmY